MEYKAPSKRKSIRNWYMENFPSDELGKSIRPKMTFAQVWLLMLTGHDIYHIMGVGDSVIRERIFEGIAESHGFDYEAVYNKWLANN